MYCPAQTDKDYAAEVARFDSWMRSEPDKIIKRRREIQYLAGGGSKNSGKGPPPRESVTKFTPASAGRLRRYIDNYYCDFKGMITLTYGDTWPTDGRVVKKHLAAFFERIRRLGYFDANSLVWWLEFQERGAPHVHMVVTGWISRKTVARAWAAITSGDETACSRVESLRDPDGVGGYAAKYASKSDQKTVPDGYDNVGRFWGRRGYSPEGGFCPKTVAAAIPGRARVCLRGWARAQVWARTHAGEKPRAARAGVVCDGVYLSGVRVYEHEGGWSVYGGVYQMGVIWEHLGKLNAPENRSERLRGGLPRRTWRGSTVTQ